MTKCVWRCVAAISMSVFGNVTHRKFGGNQNRKADKFAK